MISSSLHCHHCVFAHRCSSELTGELRPPPRSSSPLLSPSHLGFSRTNPKMQRGLLVWSRGKCSIMVGGRWIGSTVRAGLCLARNLVGVWKMMSSDECYWGMDCSMEFWVRMVTFE
ncbi:hypothetical protein V6N12_049136 [Hibiscus sabdariffa]|uniref:Uncharacterized protein n=1 Tax=Hibiscus sabdariffa TaxID=183260 RepID=A0ABR2EJP3_9ROSI